MNETLNKRRLLGGVAIVTFVIALIICCDITLQG